MKPDTDNQKSDPNAMNVDTNTETTPNEPHPQDPKKRRTKFDTISDQLKSLGIMPDKRKGNCVRAAIYKGFITLTGDKSDLDLMVHCGMLECGHFCIATLGELLQQPDYAGVDWLHASTVACDKIRLPEEFKRKPDDYEFKPEYYDEDGNGIYGDDDLKEIHRIEEKLAKREERLEKHEEKFAKHEEKLAQHKKESHDDDDEEPSEDESSEEESSEESEEEEEELGCERGRTYVTGICRGDPEFDCGEFHNHCTTCSNFGKCIGDCRHAHCKHCGEHYFAGYRGYKCGCGGMDDN